jgi:hypothetical protein
MADQVGAENLRVSPGQPWEIDVPTSLREGRAECSSPDNPVIDGGAGLASRGAGRPDANASQAAERDSWPERRCWRP